MANHNVIDELLVDRAGLIVGDPATQQELQAPLFHQVQHILLHVDGLLPPPLAEVVNLGLRELPLGVIFESLNDRGDDLVHSVLIVLLCRLLETHIVMRVAHYVDRRPVVPGLLLHCCGGLFFLFLCRRGSAQEAPLAWWILLERWIGLELSLGRIFILSTSIAPAPPILRGSEDSP